MNVKLLPLLQTERLILREIQQDDTAEMFRILTDPEVTRQTTLTAWQRDAIDRMQRRLLPGISTSQHHRGARAIWAVTLKGDDTLIGRCGFDEWISSQHYAELGYWLAGEYWGQGIMTEAVAAVVHWAFTQADVHQITAWVLGNNPASVRVLVKNGFQFGGTLRQAVNPPQNHDADLQLYSLKRSP